MLTDRLQAPFPVIKTLHFQLLELAQSLTPLGFCMEAFDFEPSIILHFMQFYAITIDATKL